MQRGSKYGGDGVTIRLRYCGMHNMAKHPHCSTVPFLLRKLETYRKVIDENAICLLFLLEKPDYGTLFAFYNPLSITELGEAP